MIAQETLLQTHVTQRLSNSPLGRGWGGLLTRRRREDRHPPLAPPKRGIRGRRLKSAA